MQIAAVATGTLIGMGELIIVKAGRPVEPGGLFI